jgi:MoaA/NifB/PqqE/SkfB family radical SAM enzyme
MKKLIFSKKALPMCLRALRWYYNYYIRRTSRALILAIFTTNLCNLKCDICSIWSNASKSTLSFDQLKYLVDASAKTVAYISFSGGEPLLVPDIFKMVSYASAKIPYVHMVSNGLLMSPDAVKALKEAGLTEVSLSLDGEAAWHNKTHACEKSFDAVMTAVENFKRYAPGIPVVINTVIYPDRLEETKNAARIAAKLGVYHKAQPVNKHFSFEKSAKRPPDPDFRNIDRNELADLIEYLIKCPHVLNSRYFLRQIPRYFTGPLACGPTRPSCILPYFFLEVSAYGKVSPCMYATGWEGIADIGADLSGKLDSEDYRACQQRLKKCRLCDESMYMCYWEPMIQFPLAHAMMYGMRR